MMSIAMVAGIGTLMLGLPDPLAAGWQGESVCEKLIEDDLHRILRCTFAPGVGHERHYHAPHSGYVLEGGLMQITDEKGRRDVTVTTGSTWQSAQTTIHEVVNIGETTTRFLIIEIKS
jgi:beta-alanine degradation protein BauB